MAGRAKTPGAFIDQGFSLGDKGDRSVVPLKSYTVGQQTCPLCPQAGLTNNCSPVNTRQGTALTVASWTEQKPLVHL